MTIFPAIRTVAFAAMLAATPGVEAEAAFGGGASSSWRAFVGTADGEPLRLAQADCSGAAAQAAAQTGGQVLSVSSHNEGGRTVCVVTVLIPGQDGGRPRRTTITLPG